MQVSINVDLCCKFQYKMYQYVNKVFWIQESNVCFSLVVIQFLNSSVSNIALEHICWYYTMCLQARWSARKDTVSCTETGRQQCGSTTSEATRLWTDQNAVTAVKRNSQRPKPGRSSSFTTCANVSPSMTTSLRVIIRRSMEHTASEPANDNIPHNPS